jgi:hypothetical protein
MGSTLGASQHNFGRRLDGAIHLPRETFCAALLLSNSIRVHTLDDGEQDAAASLNELFDHHMLIAACLLNAAISQ